MHPILQAENFLDLGVAVLAVAIGAAVLVARPKNPANVFFAAFMAFLAAGIAASAVHIHATLEVRLAQQGAAGAMDPSDASVYLTRAERIFWITFIFDPITLLYFASIYPRRNWLHRRGVLLPFAAAALVLLAVNVVGPASIPDELDLGEHVGPFSDLAGRVIVTI